jgi:hypothetical protein
LFQLFHPIGGVFARPLARSFRIAGSSIFGSAA